MVINREGLSQVYPDGEALGSGSGDPTVNIVFVHGLRGHPRRTWEHKSATAKLPGEDERSNTPKSSWLHWALASENEVNKKGLQEFAHGEDLHPNSLFWPADELPRVVPRANIFTYGYNADVIEGVFCSNNRNSILQHGNDLMVILERSLENDLPVIFVAHSLGGIIVKAAIQRCNANLLPKYKSLLSRVRAIVFCGTPHRGSSAAAWGHLASNMVTMALQSSNDRLLSGLEIDSEILDLIQEDFLRVLQGADISVHSFQESRGLSGIKGFSGKVVDDFSSKLGYALEVTETIDANHMDMVLIGSHKISAVIKSYVRDIERKKDQLPFPPNPTTNPTTEYVYLHKFRHLDYQDFLYRVAKRHPNTCSWLSENSCFVQWRDSDSHTFFWLHGYPGQGKSVLARYTLESLRGTDCGRFSRTAKQGRASAIVCYFFCSDGDARAKSATSLVASLIHQLLCEEPGLTRNLHNSPYAVIGAENSTSIWDLWKILSLLLEGMGTRPLYIVVDALDELEKPEWESFLQSIKEAIRPETKNVKVFLTSRTEPELEKTLLSWNIMHLKLDDSTESQEDRALFIREVVYEYALENSFEEGIKEKISENIIARAKGSFLWASLAWAHFKDGIGSWTKHLLSQRLNELQQLPPGMESLYRRLLYSVDERLHAELLHILQWIVAARCTLNIRELSVALALAENPPCSRKMNVKLTLKEFLRRACPHLIQVDAHENVTLVHHSFKAFLLKTPQLSLEQGEEHQKFHVDLKQVNIQLGRDCMRYMGFENSWFEDILMTRQVICQKYSNVLEMIESETKEWSSQRKHILVRHPFLDYASEFWWSHIHGSDDDRQFYEAFKKVLNRQRNYQSLCYLTRNNEVQEPPLFLATRHELFGLVKNLIDDGHDINAPHEGCHIIHYCSTREHLQSVVCLGADINGKDEHGQTIFLRLIRRISGRQWKSPRDWDPRSAIDSDVASEFEAESKAKGRPKWWDTYGREDSKTFKEYHLNEVKNLLCNPAVDINACDRSGLTPIHAVIIHDCLHANEIRDMLMTRQDLYLNPEDGLGRTPLTLAIHWGRNSMTRTLLSNPRVDIENARIQGENPLINATRQGWTDLVKSLLGRLDTIGRFSDGGGRNVLHWAIIVGMMDVFELALKKDPDLLAIPDRQGMTPLHYAAQEGEYRAVRILLSLGASPTDRDIFGQTPLHLAATKGHTRISKALVAHLPTPSAVNNRDSMGWTALHRAVVSGNDVLVDYLVSLEHVDLTKADRHGRAAVAFAASFASLETMSILLKARAKDSKARFGQADIFCVDAFGNSLVHLAAGASNKSTLDFLITMIPDLGNRRNKWGRTARDLISAKLRLPSFERKLCAFGLQNSADFSRQRPHCCLDIGRLAKSERSFHFDWKMVTTYETPSSPTDEETYEKAAEKTVAGLSHKAYQSSTTSFSAGLSTDIQKTAMTDLSRKENQSFVPPFPITPIRFEPSPPHLRPSLSEKVSGKAKQSFINPPSAHQFNPTLPNIPTISRFSPPPSAPKFFSHFT